MTYRVSYRASRASYLGVAVLTYLCAGAACGSSQSASDAATGGGSCSANVPHGQACNTLTNVGTAVTPTCVTDAIPTGTGGTIVDGTYTLTSETYYGSTACPSAQVNATLEIAGGCVQEVSGSPILATTSTSYTVEGATVTRTVTCLDLRFDAGPLSLDTPTHTFTATATTYTIFIKNSGTTSQNPDRVETYQKH